MVTTEHHHHKGGDDQVSAATISLSAAEVLEIERILIDRDGGEAVRFLKDVVRAKIRSQSTSEFDRGKTCGIPT